MKTLNAIILTLSILLSYCVFQFAGLAVFHSMNKKDQCVVQTQIKWGISPLQRKFYEKNPWVHLYCDAMDMK